MDHVAQNAAARQRILDLVRGRTQQQLHAPLSGGWTVAAELAHLAFWEGVHVGRLRRALADGLPIPAPLPDGLPDLVNDAALPAWRAIPGSVALGLFAEASAEADAYLATLDAATVEHVRAAGAQRLVERFRHRTEHGDAIAAAH